MPTTDNCRYISCPYADHGQGKPVEVISILPGDEACINTELPEVLFISGGEIFIVYKSGAIEARGGQFMMFPLGTKLLIRALDHVTVTLLRVGQNLRLCSNISGQSLYGSDPEQTAEHTPLKTHPKIEEYLGNFIECLNMGINCPDYVNMKVRELFVLMKMLYNDKELAGFFAPLVSPDPEFTLFVMKNYRKAKNASSLALLANMSMPAFKKKFRHAFGMSAQDWLSLQKEKDILFELLYSLKSFKEIAYEYNFATTSHLNNFCLNKLKMTPGRIRNGYNNKVNSNNDYKRKKMQITTLQMV